MLGYANALESRGNIVFGGDVDDLGQIGLPGIRVERNRGPRGPTYQSTSKTPTEVASSSFSSLM